MTGREAILWTCDWTKICPKHGWPFNSVLMIWGHVPVPRICLGHFQVRLNPWQPAGHKVMWPLHPQHQTSPTPPCAMSLFGMPPFTMPPLIAMSHFVTNLMPPPHNISFCDTSSCFALSPYQHLTLQLNLLQLVTNGYKNLEELLLKTWLMNNIDR